MGFALENAHCACDGSPVPQLSETDSGNDPVGVTVKVYVACAPGVTVCVLIDVTWIPKSFTDAVPDTVF